MVGFRKRFNHRRAQVGNKWSGQFVCLSFRRRATGLEPPGIRLFVRPHLPGRSALCECASSVDTCWHPDEAHCARQIPDNTNPEAQQPGSY
ncbi:hypothetical protein KM043_013571 [Ampulex compressa]|nr:hypothetical protein KM043_013571 [Ampulex compressa]